MSSGDMKIGVIARVDPGVSAVLQVVVYHAIAVRAVGEHVRRITTNNATVLQCAVYSQELLDNGWQPFEQPSACAYLPLAYADLTESRLAEFGAVLVNERPRKGEYQAFVVDGDRSRITLFDLDRISARAAIRDLCDSLGMSRRDAAATFRAIEKPVNRLKAAA